MRRWRWFWAADRHWRRWALGLDICVGEYDEYSLTVELGPVTLVAGRGCDLIAEYEGEYVEVKRTP